MKKTKKYIYILLIIIFIVSFSGGKGSLVENLEIPVGVGADVKVDASNTIYKIPILTYSFEGNNLVNNITVGSAESIGKVRENRQLVTGKRSLLGLNKVFIISEDLANFGMRQYIDIWINNPEINDLAVCVVCKGSAEDILKYKEKGYSSAPEFINGMVKNLKQYNFFTMQYTLMDMIVRIDSEGRSLLLPYVEITKRGIETTGLAIFKKDKMISKANIEEARIINLLKEDNVNGVLSLQKDSKQYINCYTRSKRKIKCYKEGDKYKFIINLNMEGKIISNELYKNTTADAKELKKLEKDMQDNVVKMCNESINRMKCEFKADILDLGRFAAAKYGRGSGVDWNEVMCSSDIVVNVKFSISSEGRGDY